MSLQAFSGYQFGVSIIFLLYLQLFLLNYEKKSTPGEDAVASDTKSMDKPGDVMVLRRCVSASNLVDDTTSRADEDRRSHRSVKTGILKDTDGGHLLIEMLIKSTHDDHKGKTIRVANFPV